MLQATKHKLSKLQPNKRLGQNFLVASGPLQKMLGAAELTATDTVLEIGPGLGALTLELASRVKKVLAIEKDPKMVALLKETLQDQKIKNVEVINADILNYQLPIFRQAQDGEQGRTIINYQTYKVVANLPFYITNPVIMKFLETKTPPSLMVLIIQKEVAQRICSQPPHTNKLAVFCQFYSQPKIISYISKNSFWPSPKVDSAIIKFSSIAIPQQVDTNLFAKIVNAGFSQPRKQLVNNLSSGLNLSREQTTQWLLQQNIQPTQRAETLIVKQLVELAKTLPISN